MLVVAVLTTVVGAAVWTVVSSPVLRLEHVSVSDVVGHVTAAGKRVTVDPTSRLSAEQVLTAAHAPIGRSLLQVSPGVIQRRVAALPPVASVRVQRVWPHTLRIAVVERAPVAAVASAGGVVTLLDSAGVAFASASSLPAAGHLVVVRLSAPLEVDTPHTSGPALAARAALRVWNALPTTLRAQVQWVAATSADGVSFGLPGSRTVVWGAADQTGDKLAVLATLMQHRARTYDVSTPSIAVTAG
jgi:cell division protein FtsQ